MPQHDPDIADVAIIGAGPIGLEVAIALKQVGLRIIQFDRGQIGETIFHFAPATRFFSSSERIAIGDIPLQSIDQSKCTREEYLAHLRTVVLHHRLDVRTYEEVLSVRPESNAAHGESADFRGIREFTPRRIFDRGFRIQTRCGSSGRTHRCRAVVLATGGTSQPRRLDIPGEDGPHVSHELGDPHRYFGRRVLVVGGRNSAVEAALRCHHAGAQVSISYRREAFTERVKYWLKPEIEMLTRAGKIDAHFRTSPVEITPTHVTLEHIDSGETVFVPVDFVLPMIGFIADMSLFEMLGVTLEPPQNRPVYDAKTMETDVPGVYVAGTAIAGTQQRFRVFLENCHIHAARIAAALTGQEPPEDLMPYETPES